MLDIEEIWYSVEIFELLPAMLVVLYKQSYFSCQVQRFLNNNKTENVSRVNRPTNDYCPWRDSYGHYQPFAVHFMWEVQEG